MKDYYSYIALIEQSEKGYSVEFPDLQGCLTFADTEEEAIDSAKEAMGLHLFGIEEDNEPIPEITPLSEIERENNQLPVLIRVYMPAIRARVKNRFVKKTLSIPNWINAIAEHEGINFSQVLQTALKEQLHLN